MFEEKRLLLGVIDPNFKKSLIDICNKLDLKFMVSNKISSLPFLINYWQPHLVILNFLEIDAIELSSLLKLYSHRYKWILINCDVKFDNPSILATVQDLPSSQDKIEAVLVDYFHTNDKAHTILAKLGELEMLLMDFKTNVEIFRGFSKDHDPSFLNPILVEMNVQLNLLEDLPNELMPLKQPISIIDIWLHKVNTGQYNVEEIDPVLNLLEGARKYLDEYACAFHENKKDAIQFDYYLINQAAKSLGIMGF